MKTQDILYLAKLKAFFIFIIYVNIALVLYQNKQNKSIKKIIFSTFYIMLQKQSYFFMLSDEFLCKPFMLTTTISTIIILEADYILQNVTE